MHIKGKYKNKIKKLRRDPNHGAVSGSNTDSFDDIATTNETELATMI